MSTPDPDLEPLHQRDYQVRAFRTERGDLLLRGEVHDQKPPGLYIQTDAEPLTIHHMIVDLEVAFPSLEITGARVVFETHPHEACPHIIDHYQELIGLSIARGFTHRVRQLFGGPRGCTHTTALLQAMAPVAVQCGWSMRVANARHESAKVESGQGMQEAARATMNTCHVWAEDGELVAGVAAGRPIPLPIPISKRLRAHGIDVDEWQRVNRG